MAKFTRAVALPNLTPEEAARAALICYQKALEYEAQQLDLFADVPRAPAAKPQAASVEEALLQRELADTRREVHNLTVMGMRPDLSAEDRELIRNAERSARAEVKLRIEALQYSANGRGFGK